MFDPPQFQTAPSTFQIDKISFNPGFLSIAHLHNIMTISSVSIMLETLGKENSHAHFENDKSPIEHWVIG